MVEMFTALLPIDVCAELAELLDVMEYMDGVRDGDTTWTLRQKAMHALIIAGREHYGSELEQARMYRAAKESLDARTDMDGALNLTAADREQWERLRSMENAKG